MNNIKYSSTWIKENADSFEEWWPMFIIVAIPDPLDAVDGLVEYCPGYITQWIHMLDSLCKVDTERNRSLSASLIEAVMIKSPENIELWWYLFLRVYDSYNIPHGGLMNIRATAYLKLQNSLLNRLHEHCSEYTYFWGPTLLYRE